MMLMQTRWVISTFFLFISILSSAGIAHATIVFRFDGNNAQGDIYVMNDDSSHVRQLTNSPLWDATPRYQMANISFLCVISNQQLDSNSLISLS